MVTDSESRKTRSLARSDYGDPPRLAADVSVRKLASARGLQRAGDPLVLAIKVILDSSQERGQVVLAGSTRFLTEPRLSESLAGRVRFVDLWPFSAG